jgi:hypothetical protein
MSAGYLRQFTEHLEAAIHSSGRVTAYPEVPENGVLSGLATIQPELTKTVNGVILSADAMIAPRSTLASRRKNGIEENDQSNYGEATKTLPIPAKTVFFDFLFT